MRTFLTNMALIVVAVLIMLLGTAFFAWVGEPSAMWLWCDILKTICKS